VKKTNVALGVLSTAIDNRDIEQFKSSGKTFVTAMTQLVTIAAELELDIAEKLKETALSTIQFAKSALQQNDPTTKFQWLKAKKAATTVIQQFLFATSKLQGQRQSYYSVMAQSVDNEEITAKKEIGIQLFQFISMVGYDDNEDLSGVGDDDQSIEKLIKDLSVLFRPLINMKPNFSLSGGSLESEKPEIASQLNLIMNQKTIKEWQVILEEFNSSTLIQHAMELVDIARVATIKISTSSTLDSEFSEGSHAIGQGIMDFITQVLHSQDEVNKY
jgi:hypothetical protein